MHDKLFIKPANGLVIKNPAGGAILPADRTTAIAVNQFWLRRIAQGDVLVISEEPSAVDAEKKVSKKSKPQAKSIEAGETSGEQDGN